MSDIMTSQSAAAATDRNGEETALGRVLSRLLTPLARLCLANGVTYGTAEEVLKRAFVHEADALQPGAPEHGMVSRISTATGINRREVTRLTRIQAPERSVKQPLAAEVLARWTTDTVFRDNAGLPRVLNRLGPAPSFEALAQTVTRDVHPRSMLAELIRLDMVSYDENLDRVALTRADFVPSSDSRQMLSLLGDNVGDHLDAAVANVMHDGSRHLEQAVFADELSTESIEVLQPLVTEQWKALHDAMVPTITALIEADRCAGRVQDQRLRIGLFAFTESMVTGEAPANKPFSRLKRKYFPKDQKESPE